MGGLRLGLDIIFLFELTYFRFLGLEVKFDTFEDSFGLVSLVGTEFGITVEFKLTQHHAVVVYQVEFVVDVDVVVLVFMVVLVA